MRRSVTYFLLLVVLISTSLAGRAENDGAGLAALSKFLDSAYLSNDERVFGMVGFYGDPQPPQWLILSSIQKEPEVFRESVFARGKVVAERKFRKLPGQDLPHIPIKASELEIESTTAFSLAEELAVERKIAFESIHFQLRCRESGSEPVWLLSLMNRSQVSVGVVYISAVSGKILRQSWPELPIEKYSLPKD